MGWFRGNRTVGGWLTLFALAVQLVLSFGHVHPLAAASGAPGVTLAKVFGSDGDQDRHSGNSPASDAFCDICATIALTGSAQIPAPPVLVLPVVSVVEPVERIAQTQVPTTRRHVLSQSRAPPAA